MKINIANKEEVVEDFLDKKGLEYFEVTDYSEVLLSFLNFLEENLN